MAADATINIDVMLSNLPNFKNDVSLIDELLAKLGMNTGSKMDESFKSETTKIESIAKSTKKDIDQSLDKPVKFTIKADNSEAEKGVKETKAFLKDIPKSKITELKADNDGMALKIQATKDGIGKIPTTKKTVIDLENKEFNQQVETTKKKIVRFPKELKTKIIADAEEQGIKDFDKLLRKLPYEKKVELRAMAKTGEAIDYKKIIAEIPSKKETTLKADATQAKTETKELGDTVEKTGSKFVGLKEIIAGTFIGNAFSKGVESVGSAFKETFGRVIELNDASVEFTNTMGISQEQSKKYETALNDLFNSGLIETMDEGKEILKTINTQLGDMPIDQLKKVSEYSAILQSQFGMDLNESLRGINSLMTNFGLTAEDSFDYMVKGAQSGLNKTDELGDNLAEYGQLWSQAGFKADEMFAILDNGLKSGAYNLDKVNDFVKEFSISLNDGRIEDNLDKFSGKTQEIFHAFKNGEATANDVFKSVISDLKGTTNEQEKLSLASTVWSALGEDNAMKVIESLGDVNDTFDKVGGTAEKTREEAEKAFGVRVRQAIRDVTSEMIPVGEKLLDIIEKYLPELKEVAKNTFGSAVDTVSRLFSYLDKNKSTIGNITGNVKDLAKALVSGAWDQGKDILLAVADMFGLIDDNTKKIKDPLKQVDKIIENLADNKDKVELLGKAIVTMFAVKKGFEFISMIKDAKKHLLEFTAVEKATSFLSGSGKVSAATTVTQTAAAVAPSAVAGGAEIAASAGVLGRFSSLAKLSSATAGLAKLVPYLGILSSLPELFKEGSAGQKVGGFAGGASGTAVGAALGTALLPGIGTALGAGAGGWIGSKFGEGFGDSIQKSLNGKPLKPKLKEVDLKVNTDIETEYDVKKISKALTPKIEELNKQLLIKLGFDTKGAEKMKGQTDKLFTEMNKSLDKYYKEKEKKAQKDLDYLVKQGLMTQEQADESLKQQKKKDEQARKEKQKALTNMQKDVDAYYEQVKEINNNSELSEKEKNKRLEKLRKDFIKKYVKDQLAMNTEAAESLQRGADEQEDILKQLRKQKGKLSVKDLEATQDEADKLYKASVKPAKKARDEIIDAAEEKYKKTVKTAEHQYKDLGTISKAQYKDIVNKAQNQRDETVGAANDQYKKVSNEASKQHKKVSSEITAQKTSVVNNANEQARQHIGASQNESKTVQGSWEGLKKNLSSIVEAIAHGIGSLINGLDKNWGKDLMKYKFGAHAKGTSGLTEDEIALVGEEGYEVAHHPSKGIFAVGVNGPEIRPLQAGTSILPHEASKQFLSMTRGLPAHANGVWGTINNIADWIKEKAESAEEFVFDGADKLYNTVTDKLGISKFLDSLGDSAEFKVAKGGLNTVKDNVIKYAQSLFDQYQEEFGASGSFDGAMNANGVYDYLVKVAQKVIGKFGNGFYVSSGYRPGDQYHHGKHQAIDIAIPGSILNPLYTKAANYAFEKFPKEVGYVITNGMVRDRMGYTHGGTSGKWVPWGSTDHDNHVHISGLMGSGDIYHGNTNSGGTNAKPTGGHQNWMKQAGFKPSEYAAIDYIVNHESSWNPQAVNPGSGAYGLPQSLPASKLASAGSDWRTNPITQLKWMRNYVNERYGGANGALSFWKAHNWYANGGEVDKPTLAWIGEDPSYAKEFIINPAKDTADALIEKATLAREQYRPASAAPTSSGSSSSNRYITKNDLTDLVDKINNRPVKVDSYLDGKQVGHSVDQTNAGTLKRKLYTARRGSFA